MVSFRGLRPATFFAALFATAAAAAVGPAPGFNNDGDTTRYAAFSVVDHRRAAAAARPPPPPPRVVLGTLRKHPRNPLFRGTRAWEHNINNGYSSVLYDPDDAVGEGRYRVYYSAADPSFGGAIPGESSGAATLYATSDDGIAFHKPNLGRVAFHNSTDNNVLWDGTTAVAVYDDAFNSGGNASRRFVAWGNLPGLVAPQNFTYTAQLGGSAVSANGLNFTDYRRLQNPSKASDVKNTWRFDAAASLYFDGAMSRYVATMRAFRPCASCGTCPIWWQPQGGCQDDRSSTCTPAQCNRTVRAVGTSTSTASDFTATRWGPNEEVTADHDDPTRQFYSQVSWPYYNIYLGIAMVFDAVDPHNTFGKGKVHCELVWSPDGTRYRRVLPEGEVDFIPHGPATRPGASDNAFDSHICFASAHPVKTTGGDIRVYYMGGDGPHYSPPWPDVLHRNSSFGMGTLRPDGFVGLAGEGRFKTVPLVATGPKLLVTADTATGTAGGRGGGLNVSVSVVHGETPGEAVACNALHDRNVTDMVLCEDLPVGAHVVLDIGLGEKAVLYTVGFQS